MKIKQKLTILFLAITLISILTVAIISFNIAKKTQEESVLKHLNIIADLKVDKIETFFNKRRGDIKTAQGFYNIKTNLPILDKFKNDRNNSEYLFAKAILDGQLKVLQEVYEYADVMLVNPEGEIMYSTNEPHLARELGHQLPDPGNISFQRGSEGVYFSDIFRKSQETDGFCMIITAPVYDFDGKFIGVIAFEEDMGPIYEFIQDITGLGETGETLIGVFMEGHLGETIAGHTEDHDEGHALFLNPLRHDKKAALKRSVDFDDEFAFPIQNAVQGIDGFGVSVDYRGETILAAWRHIPFLNWGLVAKIDSSEVFAPIMDLKRTLVVISFIFLLVAFMVVLWISGKITNPIQKLAKATSDIAQGKLNVEIAKSARKDEIGILVNSFREMARSLQDKEKEKAEFITSASHQIRTPSTGVRFQLQSLKNKIEKGAGKKEINNILSEILDNNGRVVAITNDLFKILELGDNYLASNLAKANVKENVTKVMESYKEMVDGKKLNIIIDVLGNIEVEAEYGRVKEAFINLIDNAIKYSNDGGEIKISAKEDDDMIKFEIFDNGIGIPAKEQIHIFDKFFRASNSYLKASVGSGLGLTIVKTIIEGHGGEIGLESKEGEGSTFWFTLPKA